MLFRISLINSHLHTVSIELKHNKACLSNYSIPRYVQDRSYTIYIHPQQKYEKSDVMKSQIFKDPRFCICVWAKF